MHVMFLIMILIVMIIIILIIIIIDNITSILQFYWMQAIAHRSAGTVMSIQSPLYFPTSLSRHHFKVV